MVAGKDTTNPSAALRGEGADLRHKIEAYKYMVKNAPAASKKFKSKECDEWLTSAEVAAANVTSYTQYDEAWDAIRAARHILCDVALASDLDCIALDIRDDLDYVHDEIEKKALIAQYANLEKSLHQLNVGGEASPEVRCRLHQLSQRGGNSREAHWHKVNLFRLRLEVTATLLVMLVIVLVLSMVANPAAFQVGEAPNYVVMGVAIFGAIGGSVSALWKREKIEGSASAFYIERALLTLRPIIGAAAGLVIYFIPLGLLGITQTGTIVYVVAFAAGFSERFFLRSVNKVINVGDRSTASGGKKP